MLSGTPKTEVEGSPIRSKAPRKTYVAKLATARRQEAASNGFLASKYTVLRCHLIPRIIQRSTGLPNARVF